MKVQFKNDSNNGTDDTSPTFKAFEEGSETMSKEANVQLAIRQEKFIRDLKNALLRIENKIIRYLPVTGHLIQKERLKLVPHATLKYSSEKPTILGKEPDTACLKGHASWILLLLLCYCSIVRR